MKLIILCFLFSCVIYGVHSSSKENGQSNLLRVCYYRVDSTIPIALNASLCTHIIAGFSTVKNGVIDLGPESMQAEYRKTVLLKKQNPELKILLTVGGGGGASGFSEAFNSTWNRTRFIVSTFAILEKYGFDGLDIDWEFPVWSDNNLRDKPNFVDFLQEFNALAKVFARIFERSPAILSVAVAAPKNIVDASYNITEMAKYVDFINLMTYDFHDFFWYTPFTGHNSPLFNRSVEKSYFATLNTAWVANYWYNQGMPKSKIMVGIPTYAHTYTLLDPKLTGVDAPATGSKGDLAFPDVCKMLQSGGTRVFDNESQVPYAYRGLDWVSYEDDVSIRGKAKWIKAEGFGGAMTFDLNADDWSCTCDKTPFLLHRIIYSVFSSET